MDTPLTVCEERDVKGLYKKARAGEIRGGYYTIIRPFRRGYLSEYTRVTITDDSVCSV